MIKSELRARISPTEIIVAEIEIGDSCDNGYESISVSFSTYERSGSRREDKITFENRVYYMTSGGTDNELILEHFPELEAVLKVNGMDMFGFDSYPIINTAYHCKNSPEYAQKQYRLTTDEVKLFAQLNETALAKNMYRISKERYASEITEAVKVIEKLSGKTHTTKEFISHQLENDIVYTITSKIPEKERGWNLIKGTHPKKYSIELED